MTDDRDIAAAFTEGLEPIMEETPPAPEWESLRVESGVATGGVGQWWMAAVAAAIVLVVGVGSVLLTGWPLGGDDADSSGDPVVSAGPGDVSGSSIEGRWVLESWEEDGERVSVEVGVNAAGEPWIEFTQTFEGTRESFVSGDGTGTAGTFTGSTGCNDINPTGYEYSAGFLVLEDVVVSAVGCEPDAAEQALLAMLWNTPDGIEVVMDGDRMEWFGSNLEGITHPLVFRREGSPPLVAGDGASTTVPQADDGPVVQVYDVVGVEVVTLTRLDELPDRATRVEFTTTVIDSGDGPELCLGGVDDSLPPQCSGPVAAGLDMEAWPEEAQGVRWGDRTVVVSWPPVDGVVDVVGQSRAVRHEIEFPPGRLPAVCEGVETGAGARPINEYARSLGDRNGGVYLANDGTVVLQVVGDPAPHRDALAEIGGACVVEVPRSEAEQRSIQTAIVQELPVIPELAGSYGVGSGSGGRLDVVIPVADGATARAIAGLVDDPTAIRVVGIGVLVP